MIGVKNAYYDYFKDDDDDDLDELLLKEKRKKIIIFAVIGTFVLLFIIFTIIALFTKNPYYVDGLVEKNDFDYIDDLIDKGQNFGNTDYFK